MILFEHPVVDISSSDIGGLRERSDLLQFSGHHWLLSKHSPAGVCYNELKKPLKTTFWEPAHIAQYWSVLGRPICLEKYHLGFS